MSDPHDTLPPDDDDDDERRAADALEQLLDAGSDLSETRILSDLEPGAADELLQSLGALRRIEGALKDGTTLPTLGEYRLIRELGRGAMGVVYEAEQLSLQRSVALKVLRNDGVGDEIRTLRFRNEARAAASLQHANIVPVHAFGTEQGTHFYVMQRIDGISLRQLVEGSRAAAKGASGPDVAIAQRLLGTERGGKGRDATTEGGAMRSIAGIVEQAARAVHHAHLAGVLHRDIKPANLMIESSGHVWVTDFGLAHFTREASSLTLSGEVVGTLAYCSPEQIGGQRVDERSDVYSLGVTLFELATRQPPFAADDRGALIRNVLQNTAPRPSSLNPTIPRDLETIIDKAMAREPRHRYASAAELADDLCAFREGRPIAARAVTRVGRAMRWAARKPALASAIGGLLLLAILTVAAVWTAYEIAAERDRSLRAEARLAISAARTTADNLRRGRAPGRRQAALSQLANAVAATPKAQLAPAEGAKLRGELRRELLDTLSLADVTMQPVTPATPLLATHPRRSLRLVRDQRGLFVVQDGATDPIGGVLRIDERELRCQFDASGDWLLIRNVNDLGTTIWNWADDRKLATPGDGRVRSADARDDVVVVATNDRRVFVGSFAGDDWRELPPPPGSPPRPDMVRLAPGGRDVVIGTKGHFRFWIHHLEGTRAPTRVTAQGGIWDIAWRPDGAAIAAGNSVRTIEIFDLAGKHILAPLQGNTETVSLLEWNHTGELLASCGWGHVANVWDAASGNVVARFPLHALQIEAHPNDHCDLRLLDVEGHAAEVTLREHGARRMLATFGSSVWLHPDDQTLLVGERHRITCYDRASLKQLRCTPIEGEFGSRERLASVAWIDAETFAVTDEGRCRIYRFARVRDAVELTLLERIEQRTRGFHQVHVIPDTGGLLRVEGADLVWHAPKTFAEEARIAHQTNVAEVLHVSPDGRYATFDMHGTLSLTVVDVRSREIVHRIEDAYLGARTAFSPDSQRLAVSTRFVTRILEVGSFRELERFDNDNSHKSTVAWLPDGEGLLINDLRDRVRLISPTDARERLLLSAQARADVFELRCASDGSFVVGATRSRIFVWDLDAMTAGLRNAGL